VQLLDIVHPAARILTDIARSQDAEVGDGTTSVVVLAGEILKEVKEFVEQGVSTQIIIKGLRRASGMAVNKVKEISVSTADGNKVETLRKLAATAMSSKLIHRNADFFTKSKQVVLYVAAFANQQQWWLMLSFHSIKTTSTKSSLV
jgi:T-complex protein 1 subunit eta